MAIPRHPRDIDQSKVVDQNPKKIDHHFAGLLEIILRTSQIAEVYKKKLMAAQTLPGITILTVYRVQNFTLHNGQDTTDIIPNLRNSPVHALSFT